MHDLPHKSCLLRNVRLMALDTSTDVADGFTVRLEKSRSVLSMTLVTDPGIRIREKRNNLSLMRYMTAQAIHVFRSKVPFLFALTEYLLMT
jgi:hypothetical protein